MVPHTEPRCRHQTTLCCCLCRVCRVCAVRVPPCHASQVNAEGVFQYAYVPWFAQALQVLALSGVHGVAVDVWVSARCSGRGGPSCAPSCAAISELLLLLLLLLCGCRSLLAHTRMSRLVLARTTCVSCTHHQHEQWCAVERAPQQYSWTAYRQLFEMVRAAGLRLQVVLSFHACGGNVGDGAAQVPLPPWVLQVRGAGVAGVVCVAVGVRVRHVGARTWARNAPARISPATHPHCYAPHTHRHNHRRVRVTRTSSSPTGRASPGWAAATQSTSASGRTTARCCPAAA
jgi:hypothetical protein